MGTYNKYLKAFRAECNMHPEIASIPTARCCEDTIYMANITHRILEIAESSTIPRCVSKMGHLDDSAISYESVGAHTNLTRAIVEYALDHIYGWGENSPNYERREFNEAVLIHDLRENMTGDIPDNQPHPDKTKDTADLDFFRDFARYYHPGDDIYFEFVQNLLAEMYNQSTIEGRIIYLADKLSAIIMNLKYNNIGIPPYAYPSDPNISDLNRKEMKDCDYRREDGYLLSEVWTKNFLQSRSLQQYDDSGFFTAVLIMATLLTHGRWYSWRKDDYYHRY